MKKPIGKPRPDECPRLDSKSEQDPSELAPMPPSCAEPTRPSKGRLVLDIIKELHQTVLPMDSQE